MGSLLELEDVVDIYIIIYNYIYKYMYVCVLVWIKVYSVKTHFCSDISAW